ncbi:hypothetical protein L1887_26479 [Cichorium endivia]|nr:hypothetical protein L1887_26479 [Cichorium endivia]
MESLSRPFHSRKLSNASTFSAKHDYDGVFSGHRHNYAGASPINIQDYHEIFGSSPTASSIPVLDLSTLAQPSDALNSNFRSSKPDYAKIFGRFRDEDVAVSYEELFGRDKARTPSSTKSTSQDSDNLSRQSSDALKQFNMSYSKISQKSKDGIDGTRHVTQLHAIPGFTCFIDETETVPPLMEAKNHESSPIHGGLDSSKRSKHHPGDFKVHPSTVSSPSASENPHGAFPPDYLNEELDVNSAASALKKAIEKAQESIRIAKESVGRKKKGLRSFSGKSSKGRMEDVNTGEEHKCKDEVKRVFDASSQVFHDVGRNRKYSMDSEKLFVAKKFIDEIHGKFSESTKECSILKENTEVRGETVEVDVSKESKENKDEVRVSNAHELVKELNELNLSQKVEDEKEIHQEEVLEEENIKNADTHRKNSDVDVDDESDKFYKVCEIKTEGSAQMCDNSIQESKESEQDCDDNLEESEASLQDDCEMNQEDNYRDETKEESLDNFCDQEPDEILSSDDNVSEETDKNVETFQETDTGFAQNGTEDNDVQSESSFSEEEESKIQVPHEEIPGIASTNDNQEPVNEKEKTMEVNEEMTTSPHREKEDEVRETGPSKVVGKDHQRSSNEVSDREREREKDRLAVDRAIREARERARERAERAAVEKATEEIRQRMMADAREKAAKASAQSKLRAERAAVERATSEARQRALEKAMSQKSGPTSESALRSKAKLEKHNRIMERAAKALAEKEKRDLLAQKEQAERNRLAENLDADIKRWSSGKEGNLRALLSTLQYILGGESGWQPVTLTEIIATSAVKKAYRKATLCVHPDKLQQRGASIQHKYICEKVFDLLKAAWTKFNSEEK